MARESDQLNVNPFVLVPGEPMAMYHWEADQEAFLVVSGEATLIVEGEERPLRAWDFVHCPPSTKHVIVGAGSGPCLVVAVGSREHDGSPTRSASPPTRSRSATARASRRTRRTEATRTRTSRRREPTAYREGWLPD